MTAKDKEYIDRQTNQLRSDINQMSKRLVTLEGRPVELPGSDIIKVDVDMTQFRSIVEEYFNPTNTLSASNHLCSPSMMIWPRL